MCSILLASFSSSMIQSYQMRTTHRTNRMIANRKNHKCPYHTHEKLAHFDQIDQRQSKSVTISNDTINASRVRLCVCVCFGVCYIYCFLLEHVKDS